MLSIGRWTIAALVLACAARAAAVEPGALLDPKDAFRLSATALDRHTVLVEFRIAPGYYLYRERFRFETASGKAIAGAVLPKGEIEQDPFFGRTGIYRGHVAIRVPLAGADLAKRRVRLEVVSQGCADVGICFLPQKQWVEVRFP